MMHSPERIQWYHTPIPKEQLRELTTKQDLIPFIHILAQFAFSLLTGTAAYLAYLYLPWPFFIAAVFVHCTFYGFLGPYAAIHELSHRTVFKTRWLNEFFIRVCSFLTWTNFVAYRASHAHHHQLTCHSGRDLEVVLPEIVHLRDWISFFTVNLFNFQGYPAVFVSIPTTVRNAFGQLKGEWEHRIFPESEPKNRRRLFNWARVILAGHLVLAAMFLYLGLWPLLLLITFATFIAPWLEVLCTLPQHICLKPSVPDFRLCCRSMLLSPFLSFFYWNMNYHIEHHMYAAVPFYNLPKLHELIKSDLPPVKRGLLANWKEIRPLIQKQQQDPDYCFVQDAPNPKFE